MDFTDIGIKTKSGKGTRYSTTCPKCSDTRKKKGTPCLTINDEEDNRWFHCNHCGWSGNMDIIAKNNKVYENSQIPKSPQKAYPENIRKWIQEKGFTQDLLLAEKVFSFSSFGREVLGFPFYVRHTLVNVKYRNVSAKEGELKFWQIDKKHGTKSVFFGLHNIDLEEDKTIIICEGETDYLTYKVAKFRNVLSVPQGAPSQNAKNFERELDYLNDKFTQELLGRAERIIIATDGDAPGIKLRDILATKLGKAKCRYVRYPEGYKDANEVYIGSEKKKLKSLGQSAVQSLVRDAKSFPIKGVLSAYDVAEGLDDIRNNGIVEGLKCGMPKVDKLFTLKRPYLYVITAIPGYGKSTFVRDYLTKIIKNNPDENLKFASYTPEMRPPHREIAKMAEVYTGKKIYKKYKNAMSNEQYQKSKLWVQKHFNIICPDQNNYENFKGKKDGRHMNTLDGIMDYIKYLVITQGVFGYVIDSWNKIEHNRDYKTSDSDFIGYQLDKLLEFNEYYNLCGIIVAHPRKIDTIINSKNYPQPTLYSISGSAHWYNRTDVGIILHRKPYVSTEKTDVDGSPIFYYNKNAPTTLSVDKVKFEELGNVGQTLLRYNVSTSSFEEYKKKKKDDKEDKDTEKNIEAEQKALEIEEENDELPF